MAAGWLQDILGPTPPSRVVYSSRRSPATPMPGGSGGAAAPAASNVNIQDILSRLQSSWDAANAAGETQYNNLLSSVNDTKSQVGGMYDQASSLLSGMGTSARTRVESQRKSNLGSTENDLINRGLGNTTVRTNARRGVNSDAERANESIDENVAGAQSGLLTQKAGATADLGRLSADSILSRQNQGPDASTYASLLASLGQSGGGGAATTAWQPYMGPAPGVYWSDYNGPRAG